MLDSGCCNKLLVARYEIGSFEFDSDCRINESVVNCSVYLDNVRIVLIVGFFELARESQQPEVPGVNLSAESLRARNGKIERSH